MKVTPYLSIQGSGKKKKKASPQQRAPVEAPNTLQSNATGQILDLLAFGPIKGVVGGMKGVLLDDTPIQNEDGTLNFEGIKFEERHGDPDQSVIDGFQSLSNAREINTEIKHDTPAVRSVNNPDASSVVITVRVPSLLNQDTKTGDTNPHSVPLSVHVQRNGVWYSAVTDTISGKTTAPYERSYRIRLRGEGPFSVRVQRNNIESDKTNINDDLYWTTMTEIVEVKHNYPYCALAGITVEARLFGNEIPSRKYLTDLSIIKVPSNYNPVTRKYTGLWDGTFKMEWSDNPAWCFYDLATHPIIGAGIEDVNKFALYEIGQYCDELVPDGFGGMEPRFTCNTLFASQEDAVGALNTLASVFRGMAYWGSDTVEPVADMPKPVSRIIRPSDVIDGEFTYSGTSLKERHSVAIVMWNDPEDGYESKPEMIENAEMIDLVGWRELRVTAVACTSRGQARRLGLWALYSEQYETQTVEFSTTVKNADLRPGDIIQVADPYRAGSRTSGRLEKAEGSKLFPDAMPEEVRPGWSIVVESKDKSLQSLNIIGVGEDHVIVSRVPTDLLDTGGFAFVSSTYQMPHFRIVSVTEGKDSSYTVRATEYNPGKYDYIEKGLQLPDVPESILPTGQMRAPKEIQAKTYRYLEGDKYSQGLTVGWTAPDDSRADRYLLEIRGPNDVGFRTVYVGLGLSYDEKSVEQGTWTVRVRSDSSSYGMSAWTSRSLFVENLLVPEPPTTITLEMKSLSATVTPRHPYIGQEFEVYRSLVALPLESVTSSSTFLGTGSSVSDTGLAPDTSYHYYARAVNNYGKSQFTHAVGTTLADAEDILNLLLEQHQKSQLGQWFQQEIGKISGEGPGSVNERLNNLDLMLELGDLEDRISALDDLFQFADYDAASTYTPGQLVSSDGKLYSALAEVPINTPPPSQYWKEVGTYDSLGDVLTAMAAQVSQVETRVEEVDGRITSQAARVDGLWSRIRPPMAGSTEDFAGASGVQAGVYSIQSAITEGDEALANRLDLLHAEVNDDIRAALRTESEARADLSAAVASELSSLSAQLGDTSAALQVESTVRAQQDGVLASQVSNLGAKLDGEIGNLSALIQEETGARITDTYVLTSKIDNMGSRVDREVGYLEATIQNEATTRADGEEALSTQISKAQSVAEQKNRTFLQGTPPSTEELSEGDIWYKEGENNRVHRWDGSHWVVASDESLLPAIATVQSQIDTLADDTQAQAQHISDVQASVAGNQAFIQQVSSAQANTEGRLDTMWGVKMQISATTGEPVFAGFGMGIEGGESNFTVSADKFRVVQSVNGAETVPFGIQDGKTILNSAIIGDATIDFAKISDTIRSTNWDAAARTGWRLQKNGNFTIYGGSPGQGYIEINNDGMRVYDSAGRIRVKLGRL